MANRKNRKKSIGLAMLGLAGLSSFIYVLAYFMRGKNIALIQPKGYIADEQYQLLLLSTLIMVAFALIVMFFIYFFAWKYRETNQKSVYNPTAGRSRLLIFAGWTSPLVIFAILASMMLPATQKLEPQRAIASDTEQLTIRVIAMRWKWLFMYPEQNIATVNFVQIPVDTPIRFELTADEAPMNSFWIPNLGGMLYSMTEHVNPLNLMAHTTGEYDGGAAEINGHGFAGMRFKARVSTRDEFNKWASDIAANSSELEDQVYARLLEPSEYDEPVAFYSPTNQELFNNLLDKYAGSHSHYNAGQSEEDSHTGGDH